MTFGIVGVINTVSDFIIFNILYAWAHFPLILANICAVSLVMGFSLYMNKRFVFKNNDQRLAWTAVKFVGVTLSGLYVIQNIILLLVLGFLEGLHGLTGILASHIILANIAKAVGVGGSAVWNFALYKIWVFRAKEAPATDE